MGRACPSPSRSRTGVFQQGKERSWAARPPALRSGLMLVFLFQTREGAVLARSWAGASLFCQARRATYAQCRALETLL